MAGVATNPVLLQELSDNTFDKGVLFPNQVSLKIDPASSIVVTTSTAGLNLAAPVTTNELTYGAPGPADYLISTVNGVQAFVDLLPLKLFPPTNTFTYASSTGVLTSKVGGLGVPVSVTIPSYAGSDIGLVPARGSSLPTAYLAADGAWTILPVTPPTTNVLAITKAGGAVSTVDGVASTQAIPTGILTDILGFNAAGVLVMQAVTAPKPIIIEERYATTAIDYSAVIGFRTPVNPAIDTVAMTTLIDVTATGATVSLPFVSAGLAPLIIGVEIDVVAYGAWIGSVTVKSSALINGANLFTFAKTTTVLQDSPSRCFRWTGTTWRIV